MMKALLTKKEVLRACQCKSSSPGAHRVASSKALTGGLRFLYVLISGTSRQAPLSALPGRGDHCCVNKRSAVTIPIGALARRLQVRDFAWPPYGGTWWTW